MVFRTPKYQTGNHGYLIIGSVRSYVDLLLTEHCQPPQLSIQMKWRYNNGNPVGAHVGGSNAHHGISQQNKLQVIISWLFHKS